MRSGRRRILTSRVLAAGLMTSVVIAGATGTPPVAAQDEVTMIVGLTQPWETLNPVAGILVSEFEVWNIQYLGLTTPSREDLSPQPGLAESWVENEPGLSYTYTLRPDLRWSDGTPLTAEDVAWNVNTAREQEWANYISTVENLSAEVVDERTVTITSSVPDPRLPALGIYLLPQHVWEEHADPETIDTYDGLDGVGSGPFTISEYRSEESLTMVANEHHPGGRPAIDKIIFRYFSNPDAMVAAIRRGEIDAADGIPASAVASLENDADIDVVVGVQGSFDEIAFNAGEAEGQPHPAVLDLEFRRALNHAIDKEGATEDLWYDLAEPAVTVSVSTDPKWLPDVPDDDQFGYDPELANRLLDDLGYLDTDGDGFREPPGGGDNIVLRHAVNTDTALGGAVGELFSGWMNAVGIDVELTAYDQDQLFTVIADGDYDTFYWGWAPFVDPDPMLSFFTEAELGNWNDANWTNPRFEELYLEQRVEVDLDRRIDIVHEMVRIIHDDAAYVALWFSPEIQAVRTDRFEGWEREPAEDGPVMFSQSSPSYALLQPVGATGGTGDGESGGSDGGADEDGGGGGNGALIAVLAVAAAAAAGAGVFVMRRRGSADDRE
jgi:peptide/nickel transport system substrate-binding protein